MFSLAGKTAVVTGAASGIGRATAERFAAAGADVVLADLADATDLAARLGGTFVATDVSDERAVAALMSRAAARRGRIDVAVNNAGITGEAPLAEADAGEFQRMIRVNMMSVVFGLKHAAPHMTAGGSIINTSSLAGLTGFPTYGAYAASKAAIVSLTQVAAMEYGPLGIRVNAICPSSVDTPMLAAQPGGEVEAAVARIASPLGRIITAGDIAALMHFLAADDCPVISGQALSVDAGRWPGSAWPPCRRWPAPRDRRFRPPSRPGREGATWTTSPRGCGPRTLPAMSTPSRCNLMIQRDARELR